MSKKMQMDEYGLPITEQSIPMPSCKPPAPPGPPSLKDQSQKDIADINNRFTYHSPKSNQVERYGNLRNTACHLAYKIEDSCPPSRERSLALTKLQEAVMWANASIACNE